MMAAISSISGEMISITKDKYFKQDDMIEFLQFLKRRNCGKNIAIFMDNCSVPKTKKVKQFAIDNHIEIIFNIAYCPWYNGIEKVWAVMKQRFRKLLTESKIRNKEFNLLELILKVESDLKK